MKYLSSKTFTTAMVLAALNLTVPAVAGEPGSEPATTTAPPGEPLPGAEQQQPMEVTDEKLQQFVKAAEDVQKIQEDYAAKAQSLQKTTEEQIVSSVQDAGMSVQEFTELVARVQSDPDLARRLTDLQGQ